MRPATRIKLALRAALRRRYGYASLRVLRRGVRAAVADHRRRELGAAPYASEFDQIAASYWRALVRLRRRWPSLDLADPRAEP